jgi:DNA-binding IclR family transcriptional regulator
MSVARTTTEGRILPEGLPDGIDSSAGKLLYLYLSASGESHVEELVERLSVKRTEAFGILSTLERRGLVERVAPGTFRPA